MHPRRHGDGRSVEGRRRRGARAACEDGPAQARPTGDGVGGVHEDHVGRIWVAGTARRRRRLQHHRARGPSAARSPRYRDPDLRSTYLDGTWRPVQLASGTRPRGRDLVCGAWVGAMVLIGGTQVHLVRDWARAQAMPKRSAAVAVDHRPLTCLQLLDGRLARGADRGVEYAMVSPPVMTIIMALGCSAEWRSSPARRTTRPASRSPRSCSTSPCSRRGEVHSSPAASPVGRAQRGRIGADRKTCGPAIASAMSRRQQAGRPTRRVFVTAPTSNSPQSAHGGRRARRRTSDGAACAGRR